MNTNEKGIANTISTCAGNRPVDNFIKVNNITYEQLERISAYLKYQYFLTSQSTEIKTQN